MSTAAQHPHLTVVPPPAAAPLEGVVVEKAGRPAWLGPALSHAKESRLYLPHAGRGYRRLGARWVDRYQDDYPHMIAAARQALREAPVDKKGDLKQLKKDLRAEYLRHRLIHLGATSAWTLAGGTGLAVGTATGGLWVDLAAALGAWLYGIRHGVNDTPPTTVTLPAPLSAAASSRIAGPYATPAAEAVADEPELRQILAQLGFPNITIVGALTRDDGTRTVTFDLGGTGTVTKLRKETEGLAAALGRDLTMIDIDKVPGNAGRASLWMADSDPFEAPRPSPLLTQSGAIDSWRHGLPVAYDKRFRPVMLPLVNQNGVVAGGTRSGKGVAASNVTVGASMDPWVNLRIVAGKHNGEWDPYARAGIASTYFKPSAERLLQLIKALLADKNRRERELGLRQKSKMIPDLIAPLGGIELLIIDELATYTRPGKPLRDEILEALTELAAVAAGAGILMMLITQYPDVDVIPQALSANCKIRWAMPVENATQSNAILGAGQAGAGRDASKFDPPRPGLGWLRNPFAGTTDLARSFDLDEDERGEITTLLLRGAEIRQAAGRLAGQWEDPIEKHLLNATGLSSAAGGPKNDGVPGRSTAQLTDAQRHQIATCRAALDAMDQLGRDAAQLDEMASIIGAIKADELGDTLRAAGAGGSAKVTIDGRRVNGYRRADIQSALSFLLGA